MSDVSGSDNSFKCIRTQLSQKRLEFTCPVYVVSNDVEIHDLNSSTLALIESLRIKGVDGFRGPLTGIPSNICRLPNLKVSKSDCDLIINPFLDFGFIF